MTTGATTTGATTTAPVFDFHVRLAPRQDALRRPRQDALRRPRQDALRRPRQDALRRLLGALEANGITRAAVAAGGVLDLDRLSAQLVMGGHVETTADNEAVLAACAESGGRLVPFYFANPYAGEHPYRRQAHLFRGLELSPAVYGVGFPDPRCVALVQIAAEHGHPVYTVCTGQAGARAADLAGLARRFPSVPFVSGHCGFIGIDTNGINEIAGQPNIYAETSGCLSVTARVAIERLGADRVLFGTEYPLQDPAVELAKYTALRLDPRTWAKVAWRNAHRLLAEELSEEFQ